MNNCFFSRNNVSLNQKKKLLHLVLNSNDLSKSCVYDEIYSQVSIGVYTGGKNK